MVMVADGYFVPGGESEEVVPRYPVLAPGQAERGQVAPFNPAQDGHLADPAMPGHRAGGEIGRVGCFRVVFQAVPPQWRRRGAADGRGTPGRLIRWLTLFTRLTVLTKVLE